MSRLVTIVLLVAVSASFLGCSQSNEPVESVASTPRDQTVVETPSVDKPEPPVDEVGSTQPVKPESEDAVTDKDDPVPETDETPTDQSDSPLQADTDAVTADEPPADSDPEEDEPEPTKLPEDLLEGSNVQPLNENNTVLLDLEKKRLLLKSTVCLTLGQLEMLLCLKQTKEHESILTIDAKAFTIHTGLLALGCKEGKPFRYDPENESFHAPEGQAVDIFLNWMDTDGKLHREDARTWVRKSRYRYYEETFESLPEGLTLSTDGDLRYDEKNKVVFWYGPMSEEQRDAHLALCDDPKYQKAIKRFFEESQSRPLKPDWLFVGSGFYDDEERGRQYLAEGGYVICVANFSMSLLDLAAESSAGADSLTYEAWTERIPPRDSEVLIELVPRVDAVKDASTENKED